MYKQKTLVVLSKILEKEYKDIVQMPETTMLSSLGMTSIQFVELIVEIEREFNIEINDSDLLFEKGNGVDENRELSYQLYEKAAMTGNAEAQWRYAYVTAYWKGDIEKAKLWYKKSVEQGNDEAKRLLKALDSDA